ncbi:MAG: rhomboid family intramembrane serine protease [Bacteroidia bacterium]
MITYIILAITVITSIIAMDNYGLKGKLMFNPYSIRHHREWYRFLSHGLIHADWLHLIFNMLALYMFGQDVEAGYRYYFHEKSIVFFLILYVGGLIMSSVYSYERHKEDSFYNSLGASGAVSALIFAYVLMFPTAKIGFIYFPVQMPAYIWGFVYIGIEYYLGKRGNTGIAHDAHIWGAVYGLVLTILFKPSLVTIFIDQITGRI